MDTPSFGAVGKKIFRHM